jgi:hypothetical protein
MRKWVFAPRALAARHHVVMASLNNALALHLEARVLTAAMTTTLETANQLGFEADSRRGWCYR